MANGLQWIWTLSFLLGYLRCNYLTTRIFYGTVKKALDARVLRYGIYVDECSNVSIVSVATLGYEAVILPCNLGT